MINSRSASAAPSGYRFPAGGDRGRSALVSALRAVGAEQQAATELVRLARERGLSLTGPDGLLKR